MLKQITMSTVAIATLLVSMQASAFNQSHSKGHEINKEQREQAVMIQQGIKTCAITPREAQQLRSTQNNIAKLERKFKANGLQKFERKALQNKLHSARVEINRLTKNRTTCRSKYERNGYKHNAKSTHKRGGNQHNVIGRYHR